MSNSPRKRAPNKTPEQVYSEAVEQVARARESFSFYLHLGKGRRSLHRLPSLEGLPHLGFLDISRISATDLEPLGDLPNLERLVLNDTSIANISILSKLRSLKYLSITHGPLVDITPLASLTNLESLILTSTRVGNLDALQNLTKLKRLDIDHCPVQSLVPLSGLQALEHLDVTRTRVSNLSPLTNMKSLTALDVAGTKVSDLSPIKQSYSLVSLDISSTEIFDLRPLRELSKLYTLSAQRSKITSLDPISDLNGIRRLNLDYTKIADLKPIANFKLDRLDIDGCPVTDLSPLSDQISLYRAAERYPFNGLWCNKCPLEDPHLLDLAQKQNPERTLQIISYLREQQGLPQIVEDDASESPPAIPVQGPGPHFTISYDGLIKFAPPQALDQIGNNIDRLASLQPLLMDAAATLLDGLNKNEHPQLARLVAEYAEAIQDDIDSIDFSRLFGLGLRLQNAAAAAERQIAERLLPPLEDHVREALESLTSLHGPFILSTKEGLELIEIAERYQRRPEAEREIREAALQLGQELLREPEIIEPDAAAFINDMAEEIDSGAQPERGTIYGLGITRNVSIVLIAGATCGSLPVVGGLVAGAPGAIVGGIAALIGVEGLKKTKAFEGVRGSITESLDKVADTDLRKVLGQKVSAFAPHLQFVLTHENLLRRLAGDRIQFRWLHSYLDWLKARRDSSEN